MYKKIILIVCLWCASLNVFALCQITQVPSIQFSCPPTSSYCPSTNTLTLYCTADSTITATLSTGISGSFSPRTMKSAQGNIVQYNVYLDANQQKIFGDGTQATYLLNITCNGNCNYVLYSYTFGSKVMAGTYSDNLVFTMNY